MRGFVRQWWFAVIPAVVALAFAVWGVGAPAPWWDELYTLSAVTHGLGTRFGEIALMPYYALVWLWSGGGALPSIEWIRLLSGVGVVAGSVGVALASRRLVNARVGFVAAMFFVLAPGVSRYGQEARVYALSAALVAFATWALLEARSGDRTRWWVAYGVLMGAAAVLLPAAWAVLPAHAVVLAAAADRRAVLRRWFTVVLFLTPLLAVDVLLARMAPWWHAWLAPPTLGDLPAGLFMVAGSEYTSIVVPTILLILASLSRVGRVWLLGLATSVIVIFAASFVLGSWWTARSFLPLSALLCIAASASLARAGWLLTSGAIGLVLIASVPDHVAIRHPDSRGPDAREIAAVIDGNGLKGDEIKASSEVALGYAWDLFLAPDRRRFAYVETPSGTRYWELSAQPSCTDFQAWPVKGGATLRLCR